MREYVIYTPDGGIHEYVRAKNLKEAKIKAKTEGKWYPGGEIYFSGIVKDSKEESVRSQRHMKKMLE